MVDGEVSAGRNRDSVNARQYSRFWVYGRDVFKALLAHLTTAVSACSLPLAALVSSPFPRMLSLSLSGLSFFFFFSFLSFFFFPFPQELVGRKIFRGASRPRVGTALKK